MGAGDTFKYFSYKSDNTTDYVVKLSSLMASQGGFTEVADPLSAPGWPFNPQNMRHVWGKSTAGARAKLYLADPASTKFTSGGTFTLHGITFNIQGAIGEKRALSALGG